MTKLGDDPALSAKTHDEHGQELTNQLDLIHNEAELISKFLSMGITNLGYCSMILRQLCHFLVNELHKEKGRQPSVVDLQM